MWKTIRLPTGKKRLFHCKCIKLVMSCAISKSKPLQKTKQLMRFSLKLFDSYSPAECPHPLPVITPSAPCQNSAAWARLLMAPLDWPWHLSGPRAALTPLIFSPARLIDKTEMSCRIGNCEKERDRWFEGVTNQRHPLIGYVWPQQIKRVFGA